MINFDLVMKKYKERMSDGRMEQRKIEASAEEAIGAKLSKIDEIFRAEQLISKACYSDFFNTECRKMPDAKFNVGNYYIFTFTDNIFIRYDDECCTYDAVRVGIADGRLKFSSKVDDHKAYMKALSVLSSNIDKIYANTKQRLCCLFGIDENEIESD